MIVDSTQWAHLKRWLLWSAAVGGLALAVACQDDVGAGKTAEEARNGRAAVTSNPSTDISFDLVYPAGLGITRVAIGASQDITFGALDKVLAPDGTPGAVANAGAGPITVGSGTSTGSLVSTGNIVLLPLGTTATSARATGSVVVGLGDTVTTVQQKVSNLTPLSRRTVTITPPTNTPTDVVELPGPSSLAPGAYDDVTISPGAVVTLTAGTYVIDDFVLSPLGQLQLDTSKGTVSLYVKSTAVWGGSVTGDGTRFVFGYLGVLPLTLAGSFTGTALAPNAILNLVPQPKAYKGTFYAQHVVVTSGVTVQEIATPFLATGLTVSKTTACVGDPIEVTFDVKDAGPTATPRINGVVGTHQFVQFAGAPGTSNVYATVFLPDGRADAVTTPITLQQCAPAAGSPSPITFHFWPGTGKPDTLEMMVDTYGADFNETPPTGPATYTWTFGDGQTETTTSPLVKHDFTAAVNQMAAYSFFTVSVTMTTASGSATAKKIVPIWSLYAFNRAQGIVQPRSTLAATASTVTLNVTNVETTPITITRALTELVPCDPALASRPQPAQTLGVVIPASSTAAVNLSPPAPFGGDICAMGIHLTGTAAAGSVYTDAYTRFNSENPILKQAVTDPGTIALLNQASAFTKDPNRFDETELRQLLAKGRIPRLPAPRAPDAAYANPGDECMPGDTKPGLVCQPSPAWVANPPEIMNAYAGNFIMDHGCGVIGQLLAAVGQNFSHTATISKNRTEVRHATASTDRMYGAVDYTSLKLDPDTLRFGFPGTSGTDVFSVDQMFHFYCEPDPNGNGGSQGQRHCNSAGNNCDCPSGTWRMGLETNPNPEFCQGDTTIVAPLVVRPEPDAPTVNLQPVADQSRQITGHYRFFMYSHADQEGQFPGSGWAANTTPLVCSSFDRDAASNAGLSLWPNRKDPTTTPDGMREYSPDERLTAAIALNALVHDQAFQTCESSAGSVIPGVCELAARDIGNQVPNCFARDACDDLAGDWRNPGPGVAVSPDDMLSWDKAPAGAYGYKEPLVYVPFSFRHQYVWAASPGDGSFTVMVVDSTQAPLPLATVILDGQIQGATDGSGQIHLLNLPAGTYDIAAQFYDQTDGGPLPATNVPTAVVGSDILNLPVCSSSSTATCQVDESYWGQCPNQWLMGSCTDNGNCLSTNNGEGGDGSCAAYGDSCACYPPAPPPPSCFFWNAGRQATVSATIDTPVVITLCSGAGASCVNNLPGPCQQACGTTDDCDNGLTCQSNLCAPPKRIVEISGSVAIQTFDDNLLQLDSQDETVTFDLFCDPSAGSAGGVAPPFSTCAPYQDGDPGDEFDLTANCQQDPTSGGINVNLSAKLQEGCGGSAQDKKDTSNWSVALNPATSSDPTPTTTTSGGFTCFVGSEPFGPSNHCDDNHAFLGTITYSNEVHK